tara:strand:+ start:4932 stop:5762 length:831 start_codon:yes stop_codon:yes gene_type:complete
VENFFSIIVPNLNQGKYLENCLKSILRQKYKKFEIIILDGGSNDESLRIIKNYSKKYKYITYWHSKKDKGQVDAINFGIKKSKGNWITWQNSDDFFNSKNVLTILNQFIILNPNKKLIVGNMNIVSKNKKIIKELKYITPNFYSLLYEGMTLSNQCSFWKSSLNKELGYLKNYNVDFDYEWYLRILSNYPDCGYHINYSLGSFRLHEQQKTFKKSKSELKRIKEIKKKYGMSKYQLIYLFSKYFLKLKRLIYYLSIFEFAYVFRGIYYLFFPFLKK